MAEEEHLPSAPFPPRDALTSKEKELLRLLAYGWTAREAAGEVHLSVRTVERHIENLRFKMHAQNTPHLIARAFAKGALKVVKGTIKIAD